MVHIKKSYPGHTRRVVFGIWSFLRQFMHTKFIVVVDDDINIRDWQDVIWAITTRVDPTRDTLLVDNTPIDYLPTAPVRPMWKRPPCTSAQPPSSTASDRA